MTRTPAPLRQTESGDKGFEDLKQRIHAKLVDKLDRHVYMSTWGLVETHSDGTVEEAEREHEGRTFGVPAAAMMLLFILVMSVNVVGDRLREILNPRSAR